METIPVQDVTRLISEYTIAPVVRQAAFGLRQFWHSGTRVLSDYLLIYCQDGRGLFLVDGQTYPVQRGDFCLIQPGNRFAVADCHDTVLPCVHMNIFHHATQRVGAAYCPPEQPRLNDFDGVHVPVRFIPSQAILFRDTLLNLIVTWQKGCAFSEIEAQHLAAELVLCLLRDYSTLTSPREAGGSLNWITSYLRLNLAQPLRVPDLARRAGLSPSRFTVVFRQAFGCSPHAYLIRLRLQHACDLLKDSDLTISDIAVCCGFADVHHFSKAFKKATCFSPSTYRAQARSEAPAIDDFDTVSASAALRYRL